MPLHIGGDFGVDQDLTKFIVDYIETSLNVTLKPIFSLTTTWRFSALETLWLLYHHEKAWFSAKNVYYGGRATSEPAGAPGTLQRRPIDRVVNIAVLHYF